MLSEAEPAPASAPLPTPSSTATPMSPSSSRSHTTGPPSATSPTATPGLPSLRPPLSPRAGSAAGNASLISPRRTPATRAREEEEEGVQQDATADSGASHRHQQIQARPRAELEVRRTQRQQKACTHAQGDTANASTKDERMTETAPIATSTDDATSSSTAAARKFFTPSSDSASSARPSSVGSEAGETAEVVSAAAAAAAPPATTLSHTVGGSCSASSKAAANNAPAPDTKKSNESEVPTPRAATDSRVPTTTITAGELAEESSPSPFSPRGGRTSTNHTSPTPTVTANSPNRHPLLAKRAAAATASGNVEEEKRGASAKPSRPGSATAPVTTGPSPSVSPARTERSRLSTGSTSHTATGAGAAAGMLTQREAEQLVKAAKVEHTAAMREKDTELRAALRGKEWAEKEAAKVTTKLQDTQAKLQAEKACHTATKADAKEKQAELNRELKQAVKDIKDAAIREQRLQKEVDKLTAAAAVAAAAEANAGPAGRKALDTGLTTPRTSLGPGPCLASPPATAATDMTERMEEVDMLLRKLRTVEAERDQLAKELRSVTDKVSRAEEARSGAEAASKDAEAQLKRATEAVAAAEQARAQLQQDKDELTTLLEEERRANAAAAATPSRRDSTSPSHTPRQVNFSLPANRAVEELQKDLAEAEKTVTSLMEATGKLEAENHALQALVDRLEASAESEATAHRRALEDAKAALLESADNAARVREEGEGLRKEVAALKKDVQEKAADAKRMAEVNASLRAELATIRHASSSPSSSQHQPARANADTPTVSTPTHYALTTPTAASTSPSPSARSSLSPDREGKVRMLLDKLTAQEAAFAKERERLKQRIHQLEDAVCEIQAQADEREEEARTLIQSLEDSEAGREHVVLTYTTRAADLQAELAQLQARYERDVSSAEERARRDLVPELEAVRADMQWVEKALAERERQVQNWKMKAATAEAKAQELTNRVISAGHNTEKDDASDADVAAREAAVLGLKARVEELTTENAQLRASSAALQARLEASEQEAHAARHTAPAAADQSKSHTVTIADELQREREAREALERDVASLREAVQSQQKHQQCMEARQPEAALYHPMMAAPPSPGAASLGAGSVATTWLNGHYATTGGVSLTHSVQDSPCRSQPSPSHGRPPRARSPQAPHCLDNSRFDPTPAARNAADSGHLSMQSNSHSEAVSCGRTAPRTPSFAPLPVAGSTSSGVQGGAGALYTPAMAATSAGGPRSPFTPVRGLVGLHLSLDGPTGAGIANAAPQHERVPSEGSERTSTSQQLSVTDNAYFAGGAIGSAASGRSSALGPPSGDLPMPPAFPCPPPARDVAFSVSAGRLLVSHHGRRLERLRFSSPAGTPVDSVSTAALGSVSHTLHVARTHSRTFAFTVRMLEMDSPSTAAAGARHSSDSNSSARGLLIGFADRFMPVEGFGTGRSSLRYERCYFLNVCTGRLFCPGMIGTARVPATSPARDTRSRGSSSEVIDSQRDRISRLVDVPYSGWIKAAGRAAAARAANPYMLTGGGGNGARYCIPLASVSQPTSPRGFPPLQVQQLAHGSPSPASDVSVAVGDEVSCCLDVNTGGISFTWNGVDCGTAIVGLDLTKLSLHPAVEVNEGGIVIEFP